jgi:hypothetical protein
MVPYLAVSPTIPFALFARCHYTQQLLRMQWDWEEISERSAHERIGNLETDDGRALFCQWLDTCPPPEWVPEGFDAHGYHDNYFDDVGTDFDIDDHYAF